MSLALEARNVSVKFGGVAALDSVSLRIAPGAILGLMGPNGAGKTTLVNVLTGFQKPVSGSIWLDGSEITNPSPEKVARAGVVRTFQAGKLFDMLTARENVEVAGISRGLSRKTARRKADELLEWFGVKASQKLGKDLPRGDRNRVGVARALALQPRYLLLDEPASGLNDLETKELANCVESIPSMFNCSILLIEHNVPFLLHLSHRVHVLSQGRTLVEDTPAEIQSNEDVRTAYLGSAQSGQKEVEL